MKLLCGWADPEGKRRWRFHEDICISYSYSLFAYYHVSSVPVFLCSVLFLRKKSIKHVVEVWYKFIKVLIWCFAYSLSHIRLFRCPMDCSPPGSSVHAILQARMLEWVASSRGSSESFTPPALAGKFFTTEPQGTPKVSIRGIKNPCHLQPILT